MVQGELFLAGWIQQLKRSKDGLINGGHSNFENYISGDEH